jgi:hypothetical protein
MAKQIVYGEQARQAVRRGVNQVADGMKVTPSRHGIVATPIPGGSAYHHEGSRSALSPVRGRPIPPEAHRPMAQPHQTRCFKGALARVQHLFVDMPGLQLTPADAAQMAGLDRQVCRVVLRTLTESGVLEQHMRGVFVRRSSDSVPVEA